MTRPRQNSHSRPDWKIIDRQELDWLVRIPGTDEEEAKYQSCDPSYSSRYKHTREYVATIAFMGFRASLEDREAFDAYCNEILDHLEPRAPEGYVADRHRWANLTREREESGRIGKYHPDHAPASARAVNKLLMRADRETVVHFRFIFREIDEPIGGHSVFYVTGKFLQEIEDNAGIL